ncbi:MAG: hypothetical protein K0Q46_906 [Rhodococcus erythropolis]|nr:hypothetical protein [Rhodococcus erythropolis]
MFGEVFGGGSEDVGARGFSCEACDFGGSHSRRIGDFPQAYRLLGRFRVASRGHCYRVLGRLA